MTPGGGKGYREQNWLNVQCCAFNVQMFACSNVQGSIGFAVQMIKGTATELVEVQMFACSLVQMFKVQLASPFKCSKERPLGLSKDKYSMFRELQKLLCKITI
jgi:hypothetical protein